MVRKFLDLRFIDNTDHMDECHNQSKAMAIRMNTKFLQWDLNLNAGKTKSMCTSKEPQKMEIPFYYIVIEQVTCFTYLGGNLTSDDTIDSELNRR